MKRILRAMILPVMLFSILPLPARAEQLLIPVGKLIGLQLQSAAVTVVAYDDALGQHARSAGLKIGDEIVFIDGSPVACAEDVREALQKCTHQLELTIRRGSRLSKLRITPKETGDGPRLGVYLRQGIAGIGTVTFYDPDTGLFGTLGHGVSDARGNLLQMTRGTACEAEIVSVKKGKCGDPGQLKGSAEEMRICGQLIRNTPQGVFGTSRSGWKGEAVPVASFEEVHTGPATIRCQVTGSRVREYDVEILKIYPQDRPDGRNFLIKVTDPDLLTTTGGIVQGMGVSYNKDNQDNSLACRGAWCQSEFSLTNEN